MLRLERARRWRNYSVLVAKVMIDPAWWLTRPNEFAFTLPHGIAAHLDAMSVVHQLVENAVGQSRIADLLAAERGWQLCVSMVERTAYRRTNLFGLTLGYVISSESLPGIPVPGSAPRSHPCVGVSSAQV
jgi:hypothetical protein